MTRRDPAGTILTVAVHALGVAAFVYPFFLGTLPASPETGSHAGDAPVFFAVLSALLVAMAVSDVRAGRSDARRIALLGTLAGVNAVLRLPGGFGGASLMFFLPIVCGYAFGARFGFLLGASSMAASGVITGGVGPWLPFQMWALGWVGAGAAVLRRPFARAPHAWPAVAALAAYGWVVGLGFGALTNLWFWPFFGGTSDLSWSPGLGAADAAARYWRFYLVTSLAWDSARALGNAALVAALAGPVIRLLGRFRARLEVTWAPGAAAPRPGSMGA